MRLTLFLIIFSSLNGLYAQHIPSTPEEFERQYNINIKKSRIDGHYIPENLEEAVNEFVKLSLPASVEKFRNADEDLVVSKLHFGLGKWLATNWSFYEGSRWSHLLKMKGVADPNDMIQVTLRSIHRSLNNKPVLLDEQAAIIKEVRKKEHLERLKNSQSIEQTPIPIDTTIRQ